MSNLSNNGTFFVFGGILCQADQRYRVIYRHSKSICRLLSRYGGLIRDSRDYVEDNI